MDDPSGARAGLQPTIEVGEGPTGIVVDAGRDQSLGDPRGVAWNAAGTKASVATGMASSAIARLMFISIPLTKGS